MHIVVPLAGPDFERADGRVKAEAEVDGAPLLRQTLDTRAWLRSDRASQCNLTFILRDSPVSRRFGEGSLNAWYPKARRVFLSGETQGAALSALAGVALTRSTSEPLCIDLADIQYVSTFEPRRLFADRPDVGAAALTFSSNKPAYSYLRTDETGDVVEAAEKRVISQNASAGTYFFASSTVYLSALAHNLANVDRVAHNGLFYVCPLFNGVLASGLRVVLERAENVRDIKFDAGGPI